MGVHGRRAADGTACRDGLACTSPDYCPQGQHRASVLRRQQSVHRRRLRRQDRLPVQPSSGESYSDLNDCTIGTLQAGECVSGAPTEGCCRFAGDCDDGDPCTDDR
jgi:hypothetical protein